MKEEYRDIYNALYEGYLSPENSIAGISSNVKTVADFLVRDITKRAVTNELVKRNEVSKKTILLREDGYLIIHLIYTEMILIPVLTRKPIPIEEILVAMLDDLSLILTKSKTNEKSEITAHAVLETIVSIGDELKLRQLRKKIWDLK